MIGQLDLEPGLQDLANQVGQQATLPGQLHAVNTGPSRKLHGPFPHPHRVTWRRGSLCQHQRGAVPALSRAHQRDPFDEDPLSPTAKTLAVGDLNTGEA